MLSRWAGGVLNPPQAIICDWHKLLWLDFEWEKASYPKHLYDYKASRHYFFRAYYFFFPQRFSQCILSYLEGSLCKSHHRRGSWRQFGKKVWSTVLKYIRNWKTDNQSRTQHDCEKFYQILDLRWCQKCIYLHIYCKVRVELHHAFIDIYSQLHSETKTVQTCNLFSFI